MSKILVIAAHPDDEAIGCGGSIRQYVEQGHDVDVLLLTSGELGCPGEDPVEIAKMRVHEAFQASEVLGSRVIDYWGEPDGNLQVNDDLILRMGKVLAQIRPDMVFVTGDQDSHKDHQAACRLLKASLEKTIVTPECYEYEVWSPLLSYTRVVDITLQIGHKMSAIRKHESQVKRVRFDEAALALARFRGELHNRPHGPFAEVFKRI